MAIPSSSGTHAISLAREKREKAAVKRLTPA
jgi:hypothetical protein